MDEVWEHITLPNLHHPTTAAPRYGGMHQPDSLQKDLYTGGGGGFLFGYLSYNSSSVTSQLLQSDKKLPSVSTCSCKKRANSGNNGDDAAGERRRNRLIKNRESADRSRAKRQAYTDDLEQELNDLKKENAKLRREIKKFEQMSFTKESSVTTVAQNQQHSGKGKCLQRTLTAPF